MFNMDQEISCPECMEILESKWLLNPHYKQHHDQFNGICVECGEVMNWENLRSHMVSVHGSMKNYLNLNQNGALNSDQTTNMLENLKQKIKKEQKPKYESRTCEICLFKHDKPHYFTKHMSVHISRHEIDAPITCPICRMNFPTKHPFNTHFQETHGKDKGCCVVCLEIMDACDLKGHMTSAHNTWPKNMLCSECGKAFKGQHDLSLHFSVHHDRDKESCICDHCGKVFPHPRLLKIHTRVQHLSVRKTPSKCPYCDKTFNKYISWSKHIKIHSKTKPFKCGWCEYRSVSRFNVRLHMRKIHKPEASYKDLIKDGNFEFIDGRNKFNMDAYKISE